MNIEPQPLPRRFVATAKKLRVEQIALHFSGGNDESYLTVRCHEKPRKLRKKKSAYVAFPKRPAKVLEFEQEMETWAWDNYSYSGAGDGSDYGDTVVYDLVKNEARVDYYQYERRDYPGTTEPLQLTWETEADDD
jgi:hypothetical protein